MKIAILGWGSLIWSPQNLNYDREFDWNPEGPRLPIEFSRISNDGRLTLVIDKNAEHVQTLYCISKYEKLDEAVLDLTIREKCAKRQIGYCLKEKENIIYHPEEFKFKKEITEWMHATKDIDAVIWTNLSPKFFDAIGLKLNEANVTNYLQTLPENVKPLAEEYIRKAPNQIDTKLRKIIETHLKWYKI